MIEFSAYDHVTLKELQLLLNKGYAYHIWRAGPVRHTYSILTNSGGYRYHHCQIMWILLKAITLYKKRFDHDHPILTPGTTADTN